VAFTGGVIPVSIVDVPVFCSEGPPPQVTGLDFLDFLSPTALLAKGLQMAKVDKFSEWCTCREVPPNFGGGQCAVSYFVTYDYQAFSTFTGGDAGETGAVTEQIGPITDIRAEYGPNNLGLQIYMTTGTGEISIVNRGGTWEGTPAAQIVSVVRADGLADNCGSPPPTTPTPDPPVPPPPTPPLPPPDRISPPPPGPQGEPGLPGEPGAPGARGARGAAGPCPSLFGGMVELLPGEEPSISFEQSDGCSYTMNLVLPTIETEEKTLLVGVDYIAGAIASDASVKIVGDGLYFFPRLGSVRFASSESPEVSEHFEIHGEKGFIPNPSPRKFNTFMLTQHGNTTITPTAVMRQVDVAKTLYVEGN
jgi:hypothetical protein